MQYNIFYSAPTGKGQSWASYSEEVVLRQLVM